MADTVIEPDILLGSIKNLLSTRQLKNWQLAQIYNAIAECYVVKVDTNDKTQQITCDEDDAVSIQQEAQHG